MKLTQKTPKPRNPFVAASKRPANCSAKSVACDSVPESSAWPGKQPGPTGDPS